jgi:aconitate hydratase
MSAMSRRWKDPLGVGAEILHEGRALAIQHLQRLAEVFSVDLARVPYSAKILLESAARSVAVGLVATKDVAGPVRALAGVGAPAPVAFLPARVLLQDYTGVPVVVDLAAMRAAVERLGGDPRIVSPVVPVDVIVDHSVQTDVAGSADALARNTALEFERNHERYVLLRWAQQAFDRFRVFPPGTGIIHQINLEHLAPMVQVLEHDGIAFAFPDSVCGTDSHTTMSNGLGVLGWGVGGIEAESVMLGRPLVMMTPSVVGVRLSGRLAPGVTTTDLALTMTERLRREGVVGQFVEFCGEGLRSLSLPDRTTIANMAPEYGATCAYFPVDDETLRYLRATGRPEALVQLVDRYYKMQSMFLRDGEPLPAFERVIELDLASVVPSVAGPARPQDRSSLGGLRASFASALETRAPRGESPRPGNGAAAVTIQLDGNVVTLTHGSILIAAITSCTNTSNPSVMLAAGLLARNAVARGLSVPPYVKTSLSPGSRVVVDYLLQAGLMPALQALGFHVAGYGCMTCSGSSGPVDPRLSAAVKEHGLVVSSVLSGNRNFEGRIHPLVRASYLASPPLVIAYAIAGTVDIDLEQQPLGTGAQGTPVYLRDIWPSNEEIQTTLAAAITPEMFRARYGRSDTAEQRWNAIPAPAGTLCEWAETSTYVRRPPYFDDMTLDIPPLAPITGARVLALLGDSVTTDHLSPAGAIEPDSPAGRYLREHGVSPADFNSYGSRRGNHEVMMRGTLANIRLKNMLVPGTEGGVTLHLPSGEILPIYDAALRYAAKRTPLLILAGAEYGAGSSRDWAAKGPRLLGVRAVIAKSFERIHRSNLVNMGVLPLELRAGEGWRELGLDGKEVYEIQCVETLRPGQELTVRARRHDASEIRFVVRARIDSEAEMECYRHSGILQFLLRGLLSTASVAA